MILPATLMERLTERPLIHKFFKYSMTSVVGVVMGQSLIFLFASIIKMQWGWANFWAVAISTAPTYYISRQWVWQKRGKSSLYAEVVPVWPMTDSVPEDPPLRCKWISPGASLPGWPCEPLGSGRASTCCDREDVAAGDDHLCGGRVQARQEFTRQRAAGTPVCPIDDDLASASSTRAAWAASVQGTPRPPFPFLPCADGLIFSSDASAELSEPEMDFLKRARERG